MDDKQLNQKYVKYDTMSLKDMAQHMKEVKEKLDEAKEIKSELQKEYDHLRLNKIPEKLDEEGVANVTFPDIGRVQATSDIYAAIPAAQKDEAWKWLRENGHGGIIVDYIHPGTLKATLKSLVKKGESLPDCFKVTPFSRASIVKR